GGVFGTGQSADFASKASLCLGIARMEQPLESYLPPERRLPGPVDHSHAAAAQLAEQLKFSQLARRLARTGSLGVRLRGLRPYRPVLNLRIIHGHSQDPDKQGTALALQVGTIGHPAGAVTHVLCPLPAAPGVEEQYFTTFEVIDD